MLFEAARVYARGEPGVDVTEQTPPSGFMQVDRLPSVTPNNWLLGIAGLVAAAWLAHRFLGDRK